MHCFEKRTRLLLLAALALYLWFGQQVVAGGPAGAHRRPPTRHHRPTAATGNRTTRGRGRQAGGGGQLFDFECGQRFEPDTEGRYRRFIAGGYDAGPYSYPSYVKIMVHISGFMYSKCGGTLVSRRHIVTATHCFPKNHGQVFAESTIYQASAPTRLQVARVCHLGVPSSDVTILRLDKPIQLSPTCWPACIPRKPLGSSQQAITVGLGANRISRWNPNQVSNPDELQALPVRRSECKWHDRDPAHICFRPSMDEFTGASCKGDSGGPTYGAVNGRQTVYSVVSYGSDHVCEAGQPGYSVNGDIYSLRNPIINLMKQC